MDLLIGMVSIVKDMGSVDKEYKNLNLQLKYTLDKSKRLLKKIDTGQQNSGLAVFKARIDEGENFVKKLDQLLDANSIAIKDKFRLSLPFTQTKGEIINVIETLERLINDLKQQFAEQPVNNDKIELKNTCVKRKISYPTPQQDNIQINAVQSSKNQLTVQEIDEHLEEVYQMGPTIKDDEYHYSQSKNKPRQVQFTVKIHGPEEIVKILQGENLLTTKTLIKQENIPNQLILYNVARINFQKCYPKIKAFTKDIDRISTKGHFHFIFKKAENENKVISQILRMSSNSKKNTKPRASGSQKQDQEVFFSFPADQNHQLEFSLLAKKQDAAKTLYRISGEEWIKVEEEEVAVLNGDKLAAFINPQTKLPTIYFQITYEQTHS